MPIGYKSGGARVWMSVDAALFRECTRAAPAGNLRQFLADMASSGLSPTAATAGSLVRQLASSRGIPAALG
eukprot:jgi/Mesen1/67/ME1106427C05692